ncbi:MAG: penicillin acylase family protein [Actinomycetota bacterium]|nr:penicillin acylase family protein [Actinomycetota bacterium]
MRPIVVLLVLLALPASASARVVNAEDILPPGQSGFVSTTGVASGTGSPHLTDQSDMFVNFVRKPHTFEQPGVEERPRPGVRIVRDAFGVPAIHGDTIEDMWWGAGYAVAQDRLFQLELFRRATTGRLAEILGAGYLDDDLVARRDYYTQAERARMLAAVPPGLRERLTPYKDGVNAWIDHVRRNPDDMPGEFAALGVELTDWTEDDSVAVGIFLARTVPSGSGVELQNLRTLRAIGPAAFDALLPVRTPGAIPSVPPREGVFPSQPGPLSPARRRRVEREAFLRTQQVSSSWALPSEGQAAARANVAEGLIGRVGGSYMYAVRKKKPERGAFVFNGPQLGYSIPELFVELEVHAPGYQVRGVTAAGVPLVAIGHNGDVAWGYTSGLSDEDDLYAEQLVGEETYRFEGREERMECRDETFTYRSPPTDLLSFPDVVPGAGSRTERICRTVHGPVEARADGTAYARRYAIWMRELETLEGLTALTEARTIRDVDRALQKVTWNENIVAADSQGNIGYWHPGLHPLRPRGYDERLPYPGTGEAEWRGLLPRRRTPHVINPKQGWVMNWNNVPSAGWTNGDSEASERATGPFHRAAWLRRVVREFAARPTWEGARGVIFRAGTVAQQRPLFEERLRAASAGASGRAAAILDALLKWDGSYHQVDANNTVDPGVEIWETFKDAAELVAVERLAGPGAADRAEHLLGGTGSSHAFDISNGEAYALRTLDDAGLRDAADKTFVSLAETFKSEDPAMWRTPRRMYSVSAQGAASWDDIPFFDRGTWEQVVELAP